MSLKSRNLKKMNKYSNDIRLITDRLYELTGFKECSYDKLLDAQRYSVTAGGKHLRGLILLESAKLGGVSECKALDYACALEMVHTYSLIHDDLPEMDNDELRRGVPTCHIKYGTAAALLAGDALLTKAFEIMAQNAEFSCEKRIKCIQILSAACGEHGMLAGQMIDKLSENKAISYEQLTELHKRKTSAMFCAAIQMGAALSDLSPEMTDELTRMMELLGIAFQIKDDILDITSDSATLGKPINSDLKCSKSTFVSVLGIEKSELLLKEIIDDVKSIRIISDNSFFSDLADFFINRTK